MIYIKWLLLTAIDLLLLPVAYALAPVISLFTANGWPKFGGWFYTYDNPPQGDSGYQTKRAPFPLADTPKKLYYNRVAWLWRNPLYGYQKFAGIKYDKDLVVKLIRMGGAGLKTSDKYKRAGWYYAECVDDFGEVEAFELYIVLPWSVSRCIRVRLGWKIMTDKFEKAGFAPLVDTFNPLDGYGDN